MRDHVTVRWTARVMVYDIIKELVTDRIGKNVQLLEYIRRNVSQEERLDQRNPYKELK